MKNLLIANRGEIAIRIARAAADHGLTSTAVYPEDDSASLHIRKADAAILLPGRGARAYLDIDAVVEAARQAGVDAVHPGYGFLSENADFAEAVEAAGLTFIGPTPDTLRLFGDKVRARALADRAGVPVLAGSDGPVSVQEAAEFLDNLPTGRAAILKAVAGGGGRGVRIVTAASDIEELYRSAASEAAMAFGNDALYIEEFVPRARHIEVQIVGDGEGVCHLGERECTIQRRHQKIIEVAPSPTLNGPDRLDLTEAAVRLGTAARYRSLGTIEFLFDETNGHWAFIEANARLQVEHTVTEEVLGMDLVRTQFKIAAGASLGDLDLNQFQVPQPRGYAIQTRINMETLRPDGTTRPTGGTLTAFEPPTGPGQRTDACGYVGYTTSPAYDSLLAKLIVTSPAREWPAAVQKTLRALREFRIEGVNTNLGLLRNLLAHPDFIANKVYTTFIDDHAAELAADQDHRLLHGGEATVADTTAARGAGGASGTAKPQLAGAQIDAVDPLAVLDHGRGDGSGNTAQQPTALAPVDEVLADGVVAIRAPMQGTLISFDVEPGAEVWVGRQVAVMEAMKMEHVISAPVSGVVQRIGVAVGDTVFEEHPLIYLEERPVLTPDDTGDEAIDLDRIRPDLAEALARKAAGHDESRPNAVAKRRRTNHRTARENIADLCDPDTFIEYGSVVVAAQRRRRSMDDLIENTTGDGMVCGLGQINGEWFEESRARTMIMSYDYMVLAGTQGMKNHQKKDRMFEIAREQRLPTVLFAEGGGGRPGDTDGAGVAGLDCWAFTYFARLSGLVPVVGITTGRCFAGNAVLLGCCDVIIATEGANIGIGGPAMIEGGGLGVFRPEDVGPMDVQVANGVVDIAVRDETEAVAVARKYLSYFQGPIDHWQAPDPRELRFAVPENRLRYYAMRTIIDGIADIDSVLEIREHWAVGIITALIRIEGRPVGIIANNPGHLSGAIDAPGADKGARFMQLCDAFDIPIVTLIDCPGIMVGPEIEKTALVRHACRMMVVGANIKVPLMSIVIRKAYGLGAQAMAGGSFKAPLFTVTWPTGEFGGMGLEGAVKLGYRKELQAIDDPAERKATYDRMVADSYQRGKAVNMASHFELDDVIDPATTRDWILAGLRSVPPAAERQEKKRPQIDTW